MQQKMKVGLELEIVVPETHVMITRQEYELLNQDRLEGRYWTLRDLEERTGKKHEWLKAHILNHPKFSSVLDVHNGGPVFYPSTKGEKWTFLASEMAEFLEMNFHEIFNRES